jgi:hypothetical protein
MRPCPVIPRALLRGGSAPGCVIPCLTSQPTNRFTSHPTSHPTKSTPRNPPHEIHPTKSTPRNPPHEITARFRRDPGSLRDFAGTPGRGAISQAPPSPREWPCPSSWSSALPNAARPPLGTSRDGGTRPRWRGYATRRARCLAIGPPAGRSGRDVRRRGSPAARGARGWPGSPERGNFAPSTPRRLWPR